MPSFYVLNELFSLAQIQPQKVAVVLDDQSWTYGELIEQIERVVCNLHRLHIVQGQIIYQFFERGFELICGLFGIMCAGGIYCPMNPTDPLEHLVTIIEQTQGQYVLLHKKTRSRFPSTVDQHVVFFEQILYSWAAVEDKYDLPDCKEHGAAYIICTSGTTGRPKIVVHSHKSFSASAAAFSQWDGTVFTSRDHALQVAACSWTVHLTEISVPLALGGTLVLLRQGGLLDMAYFSQTLLRQQITTVTVSPALIRGLTKYLEMSQRLETFKFVRNLIVGGEAMKPQEWIRFIGFLSSYNAQVSILYGVSECNVVLGYQLLDINETAFPVGHPLPGVQCLLIDEEDQIISRTDNTSETGQIHIGGPTLFDCYLNDPERTANMFVSIDNQVYMKTGDLARFNGRGELVYVGRVDFQIKVRGQRVETAEIENTIMSWAPSKISSCLVIKAPNNDDLLVAYVMSNDSELDIEEIRDYCSKHLRQYMVPSYIVVLDKFPLNANGKVNRKQLPLPSLLGGASTDSATIDDRPMSELEEKVHSLWCSTLQLDIVPRHMNCFALGGSSLTLMQIFNYYQFHLARDKQLTVLDFFIKPTISNHVQHLINSTPKVHSIWSPLHQVQGMASFAQERIWLDEQVRAGESINGQVSVYNEILAYKLSSTTPLSINRLRQALALIVTKHTVLRTTLIYDEDKLIQKELPISNDLYNFEVTNVANDSHLKQIFYDEETNRSLFNLEHGRVFRCHVLRYSSNKHDDRNIKQNDIILFSFHHIAIDGRSIIIFINDLRQALTTRELSHNNEDNITYLDYAYYERLEDWSNARQYWSSVGTTLNTSVDQQNSSIKTGKGYTITFDLDHDLVVNLNRFISQSNLTLFQVGLTAFLVFLFKMSNSQQLDVCTGIVVANRSQYQLQNIIGFFANTLPFCLKIDPHESFTQLCQRIHQVWLDILPHSHIPYQEIIKLNPEFGSSRIRTLFLVETTMDSSEKNIELDEGTTLNIIDRNLLTGNIAKFDTICTLYEHRRNETISMSLNSSLDIYDESTISTMTSRFKNMFDQLFSVSSIYQFSLLLPHELELMNDLNNTFVDYGQVSCIHWNIACQAHLHPQKVALVQENGSMSYSELLYYSQNLADYLITQCDLQLGQSICQLMERSFELVIGMIGIWMSGGVYISLNLHDPFTRLNTCLQQTSAHLILVHQPTQEQPLSGYSLINVSQVIYLAQINEEISASIDSIDVTPTHISHILFTIDYEGIFKAVQLSHRNLISCISSNNILQTDVVLHHTSLTFDVHLSEIVGTLVMGGQVTLLHPNGNLDLNLFRETISYQQVTYLNIMPSLLIILTNHLRSTNNKRCLRTLRCVSSGGESLMASSVSDILQFVSEHCRFYNNYGPVEWTGSAVQYLITENNDNVNILPIGRPMSNVHIYLLDDYDQPVIPGIQIGEIVIGGPGLFTGYFGCDDLTKRVQCLFNNEICFRTGDLGWFDTTNKQLELHGQRDHHMKLRSERIELKEIESIVMEIATNCVVIKAKQKDVDHLVAYVQTTHIIQDLGQHCLTRLPSHMVPSNFVILDSIPIDQHGKIDRKSLPPPDFTSLWMISSASKQPRIEMEQRVHRIWCQVLPHIDSIPSIFTSFYSLGDDPGLFIRLFQIYSINFKHSLRITMFLEHPTIAGHAHLLLKGATFSLESVNITEVLSRGARHGEVDRTPHHPTTTHII